MVSTRGVKLKFLEGEKVLCYEPDPTKAKVLYESKVKDVIVNKDERGRKTVEYLIHFRGWNSSWDRCVSEEFILKDTLENRQLQRDLAQKSKLQFGSYLYRKEQKKKNRTISSEDGSCDSVVMEEDEDHREPLSSSEDSSFEDESIPLEVTEELRTLLEHDHKQIHEKDQLHKLPATPNVINILETYWKFYVNNQKCGMNEKSTRFRNGTNGQRDKIKPELLQNINVLQEFLDGLRIYFDYCLPEVLLYDAEMGQTVTKPIQVNSMSTQLNQECSVKGELLKSQEYTHFGSIDDDEQNNEVDSSRSVTRRRTLRSYRSVDTNSNGSVHSDSSVGKPSSGTNCNDVVSPLLKIPMWKALPDYVYKQDPKPPCLQYGATHLARLFVKLPELLGSTQIVENKLKVLITHLENFMEFLGEHKEWFADDSYIHYSVKETK